MQMQCCPLPSFCDSKCWVTCLVEIIYCWKVPYQNSLILRLVVKMPKLESAESFNSVMSSLLNVPKNKLPQQRNTKNANTDHCSEDPQFVKLLKRNNNNGLKRKASENDEFRKSSHKHLKPSLDEETTSDQSDVYAYFEENKQSTATQSEQIRLPKSKNQVRTLPESLETRSKHSRIAQPKSNEKRRNSDLHSLCHQLYGKNAEPSSSSHVYQIEDNKSTTKTKINSYLGELLENYPEIRVKHGASKNTHKVGTSQASTKTPSSDKLFEIVEKQKSSKKPINPEDFHSLLSQLYGEHAEDSKSPIDKLLEEFGITKAQPEPSSKDKNAEEFFKEIPNTSATESNELGHSKGLFGQGSKKEDNFENFDLLVSQIYDNKENNSQAFESPLNDLLDTYNKIYNEQTLPETGAISAQESDELTSIQISNESPTNNEEPETPIERMEIVFENQHSSDDDNIEKDDSCEKLSKTCDSIECDANAEINRSDPIVLSPNMDSIQFDFGSPAPLPVIEFYYSQSSFLEEVKYQHHFEPNFECEKLEIINDIPPEKVCNVSQETIKTQGPESINNTEESSEDNESTPISENTRAATKKKAQLLMQSLQFPNIFTILNPQLRATNNILNINRIGSDLWVREVLKDLDKYPRGRKLRKIHKDMPIHLDDQQQAFVKIKQKVSFYENGSVKIYRIERQRSRLSKQNYNFNQLMDHFTDDTFDPDMYEDSFFVPPLPDLQPLEFEEYDIFKIDKNVILAAIRELFQKTNDSFESKQFPSLEMYRKDYKNCDFNHGRLCLRPAEEVRTQRRVRFSHVRTRPRFCFIFFILAKIKILLETNTKITHRELFYQCKLYLKTQSAVTSCLQDISCILNVGYWSLNINSQCGLMFGSFKLKLVTGETIDCNNKPTLIPFELEDMFELETEAHFILVVEKESIFSKLIDDDIQNKIGKPFILITGKGFPDLNTQRFLNKITPILKVPLFILTDADPDGVKIMLTYRFGSVNHVHLSDQLAVPQAKWLGVLPSEITSFDIENAPLSKRDLNLVNALKQHPCAITDDEIMEQLNVFLDKKRKASIEGLIKSNNLLSCVYIKNKLM